MQTTEIKMKNYDEIDENIKQWLEDIVKDDEYSLRAETLYRNIYNSVGDEKSLAKIFEVPIGLIRAIKQE